MTFESIRKTYDTLKPVLWLVFIAAIAVGFEFKPPMQTFHELRRADSMQVAALHAHEALALRDHNHMYANQESIERLVEALARGACIDRPRRETRLMGLPCDSLLRTRLP